MLWVPCLTPQTTPCRQPLPSRSKIIPAADAFVFGTPHGCRESNPTASFAPSACRFWCALFPTMSSSAVAAWGALIKCLSTLVDLPTGCADNTPVCEAARKQHDIVAELRSLAYAGWKRLIIDVQVCKHECMSKLFQKPTCGQAYTSRVQQATMYVTNSITGSISSTSITSIHPLLAVPKTDLIQD